MIIEDNGVIRKSVLKVVGRETAMSPQIKHIQDQLLVEYNGATCKVGIGFYGKLNINSELPKYAVIQHVSYDEENLRFPVFIDFYLDYK